ncbi:MAG: hypothetical protein IPF83_10085 [Rhodanobacteraceae bacterium]|nr:hypothetical protein [Rhodanobacteraceae bacterium]
MLSSTSSSEQRALAWVWLTAIVVAGLALLALDRHWRAFGMPAGLIDSKQLWSIQRDRVYGDDPRSVVFIGASRSAYGIDPKQWRTLLPETKPVMLSINGRHPIALLRDLAADSNFHGLLICDVDTHGMLRRWWDMQQEYVDYHRLRWTPNWHVHRLMLNIWQRTSVLANPALGWKASLQRAFEGGTPYIPVTRINSSRGGEILFDQFDADASARAFDEGAEQKMHEPLPPVAEFLADAGQIQSWVQTIQRRGGEVVFFQPPVSGRVAALEREYFDRAAYWDVFAAMDGIHALHADAVPAMQALSLPDHSRARRRSRSTHDLAGSGVAASRLAR